MSASRFHSTTALVATLLVVLAACGTVDDAGDTTTTPTTAVTTTTAPTTTVAPTTVAPTTTSTEAPTTTLPGEPTDLGPTAGAVVAVVGVAHDDVLNLRAGPGVEFEILAELPPTADDLIATGNNRMIPKAFWAELDTGTVTGWVNQRYIGFLARTGDDTSLIVDELGEIPVEADMQALGELVASVYALPPGEEIESRIVMVVAPTIGDLGEVTFDVIGTLDDSVGGHRLQVFGTPADDGKFSLKSVEVTPICWPNRGVTSDGMCL